LVLEPMLPIAWITLALLEARSVRAGERVGDHSGRWAGHYTIHRCDIGKHPTIIPLASKISVTVSLLYAHVW
jgi:hypothetical protein